MKYKYNYLDCKCNIRIRNSVVQSGTLDISLGSIPSRSKWFASSTKRPDNLIGPPYLLSNGNPGLFTRE
jgi:hypothetical protein